MWGIVEICFCLLSLFTFFRHVSAVSIVSIGLDLYRVS